MRGTRPATSATSMRRGRLHLVGRTADVIKTGGYKVAPEEIERGLAGALGGAELAVLGLPSEYWGEVIVAVAERPPLGWEQALRHAASGLTGYKRPRALRGDGGVAAQRGAEE